MFWQTRNIIVTGAKRAQPSVGIIIINGIENAAKIQKAAGTKPRDCGCGELIPAINKMGKPARYKQGHQSTGKPIHPNSRHTGEKHGMWRGGRYINNGYVMVYSPTHPYKTKDGYVREHRLILEQYLGRYLKPDEDAHHINGIKTDNRIENLELLNKSQHSRLHVRKTLASYYARRRRQKGEY